MPGVSGRVAQVVIERFLTFVLAMTVIFFMLKLMPGDPFGYLIEDPRASPEAKQLLIERFGLDRPLHEQYVRFLTNLFQGFMGYSFKYQEEAMEVVMKRLPWTLLLLGSTIAVSAIAGLFVGVTLAWKRGSRLDSAVLSAMQFLRSLPVFWIGIILLLCFSYYLGWLPLGGAVSYAKHESLWEFVADVAKHLILPVTTLSVFYTARYTFIVRNSLIETFSQDFVTVARAKGLSDWLIKYRHGLRVGVLPYVSTLAVDFGWMFGGAVLTETVFSYPGVGRLVFEAIMARDYPLLYASFVVIVAAVIVANLVADLVYAILDPRVRGP